MVRNTQPANAEATSLAEGLVWAKEQSVHQPTLFGYQGNLRNYNRVAFEADIPAITPNPPCHHRINAGVGCTTPPRQEPSFVPFTAPPSFCLAFPAGRRAVGISKALFQQFWRHLNCGVWPGVVQSLH